jgi:hypothetical protein
MPPSRQIESGIGSIPKKRSPSSSTIRPNARPSEASPSPRFHDDWQRGSASVDGWRSPRRPNHSDRQLDKAKAGSGFDIARQNWQLCSISSRPSSGNDGASGSGSLRPGAGPRLSSASSQHEQRLVENNSSSGQSASSARARASRYSRPRSVCVTRSSRISKWTPKSSRYWARVSSFR